MARNRRSARRRALYGKQRRASADSLPTALAAHPASRRVWAERPAITIAVTVAVVIILGALLWVPVPLRWTPRANSCLSRERGSMLGRGPGALLRTGPEARRRCRRRPVADLDARRPVGMKIVQLQNEITAAAHDVESLTAQFGAAMTESERKSIAGAEEGSMSRPQAQGTPVNGRARTRTSRPGHFWVRRRNRAPCSTKGLPREPHQPPGEALADP